ncbi:MAG0110 family membrane protein [Mycoplasmopsis glycophila]|uniref:Inhibitor of apoptosis-promoting Bax1 n=1 Tax=Mycoplasmopsis glycophila TaxID=171285 RepID=A0A449AUQ7_9BACT|nr:Bax inhibitor-1 family protein [Mycoplasmopsis glycophila]VEU70241.1 Inhibitor of apoptosis-promoting Bax1 [Mycoplasmopsis glycophila]
MFNETQDNSQEITFSLDDTKAAKKFYGITASIFSICVALCLAFALTLTYIFTSGNFNFSAWVASHLPHFFIPAAIIFILTIIFSYRLNRLSLPWLFVASVVFIIFFGFLIGVILGTQIQDIKQNAWKIVAILLAPVGIMFVMGILGYFELVDMRSIKVIASVLLFVFIILVIASFFIFSNKMEMVISAIAIAVLSLSTILQFYVMKKKAHEMKFAPNTTVWREGTYAGINLFLTYIQLVRFLLDIYGRR